MRPRLLDLVILLYMGSLAVLTYTIVFMPAFVYPLTVGLLVLADVLLILATFTLAAILYPSIH